jgi:hypothetical protein
MSVMQQADGIAALLHFIVIGFLVMAAMSPGLRADSGSSHAIPTASKPLRFMPTELFSTRNSPSLREVHRGLGGYSTAY